MRVLRRYSTPSPTQEKNSDSSPAKVTGAAKASQLHLAATPSPTGKDGVLNSRDVAATRLSAAVERQELAEEEERVQAYERRHSLRSPWRSSTSLSPQRPGAAAAAATIQALETDLKLSALRRHERTLQVERERQDFKRASDLKLAADLNDLRRWECQS